MGQQFNLLLGQLRLQQYHAGDVPARPRKAFHITVCNRIEIDTSNDDWDAGARGRLQCGLHTGEDRINLQADHLGDIARKRRSRLIGRAVINHKILRFDEPLNTQLVEKRAVSWSHYRIDAREYADTIDFTGLLRSRRERPRCRAAESRDEFAPPDAEHGAPSQGCRRRS